jgi:two-component system chemotaxis sensor kinase CheA
VKRSGLVDDPQLLEAEDLASDEAATPELGEHADVLVIDDNALNRSTVVRLLRTAGLSVISTDSAIGATRLVLRSGVSVVVADLNMPAMQGSSLLAVFRRNARVSHVAVVLLSGVGAEELVTAASSVGADAAVSKLEMATMLLPAVQRLLRRAARPKQHSGKLSLPPSILNTGSSKKSDASAIVAAEAVARRPDSNRVSKKSDQR